MFHALLVDHVLQTLSKQASTITIAMLCCLHLQWKRWYPTATLLPDGQVAIMGGTQGVGAGTAQNREWELYNPATQRTMSYPLWPAYQTAVRQVCVLDSGRLDGWAGCWRQIIHNL